VLLQPRDQRPGIEHLFAQPFGPEHGALLLAGIETAIIVPGPRTPPESSGQETGPLLVVCS